MTQFTNRETNRVDIEIQFEEQLSKTKDKLLGAYNQQGQYIIADQVKSDLLKLAKLKDKNYKNSIYCTSNNKHYGQLVFEIVFGKNIEKQKGIAIIYLLENETKVNGYYQNILRTEVGRYIDDLADFMNKAYSNLKIINTIDPNSNGGQQFDGEQSYLDVRQEFLEKLDNETTNDYNEIYRQYFECRINALKNSQSPMAKNILEKFEKQKQIAEQFFVQANDYRALSELLDKCFLQIDTEGSEFADTYAAYKQSIIETVRQLFEKAKQIEQSAKNEITKQMSPEKLDKLDKMNSQAPLVNNQSNSQVANNTQTSVQPQTPVQDGGISMNR